MPLLVAALAHQTRRKAGDGDNDHESGRHTGQLHRRANPSFNSLEPARLAMGDTRDFAERISLMTMQPRPDLSSTGFALADPGKDYLILQPSETAINSRSQ